MKKKKIFWKSIHYSLSLTYVANKITIFFYLIVSLLSVTSPLLSIYIFKNILNDVTISDTSNLLVLIIVFVVILILQQVFNYIEVLLKEIMTSKASYLYDLRVSTKLADLQMEFLDTSKGRDIVDDVRYSRNTAIYMPYYIFSIILSIYTFLIVYITLLNFNIIFSLLYIVLTIPGIISQTIIARKVDAFRRKSAPDVRKFSYYRWMLTDSWPAKDVRMYNLTNPIVKRYDEEKDKYRKANKKLDFKKMISGIVTEIIKRSGEIVFTIFVIAQALNNSITIGEVALYIGFALAASDSFENSTYLSISLYYIGTKSLGRLLDFINLPSDTQIEDKRELEDFQSLTFNNVFFTYPSSETPILKGTSFNLIKGEKMSIVGINGSGKTTIVKLIIGLYKPQSGEILINGHPINEYDINDVRKMFSVLFQNYVEFPLTLRENVAISDLSRIDCNDEIIESLKLSGIYDNYNKFDKGLDSNMTRRFDDQGIELSKGQWQKIALSRAYFKNADIHIFDEPSSALDAEAEDRIFTQFNQISKNKTGIMISHRISSAKISDLIIVLDDGKIVESGQHENLILQNGLYAKLYNLQLEKYNLKEEI